MDPLLVLPPPGPLSWLYPELAAIPRPTPRFSGRVLDLAREPARGEALRELLSRGGTRELVVPGGPLGATLARALRQLLRGGRESVRITPLSEPATLEERLAAAKQDSVTLDGQRCRALLIEPTPEGVRRAQRRSESEPGGIPVFLTPPPCDDADVTTRLPPSWWGVLPGEHYPEPLRAATRALMAALAPARLPLFMTLEGWALCGFDVYLETLLGRFAAPASHAYPPRKPLVIAICGTDGSGKSAHVAALQEHLQARGLDVQVHKLYRHGLFHDTTTDLVRLCTAGEQLHLWRLERIAKLLDSVKHFAAAVEPVLGACDVALFDRYDLTHFAAARARYAYDPCARELLALLPRPHATFLLDAPIEQALSRIGTRDRRTIDENPYMLGRYREGFLDLADRDGTLVLDTMQPFERNQARIRERVEQLLTVAVP